MVAAVLTADASFGQQAAPAEPPPVWTGSGGAGLSIKSGNSDTSNYNLTIELVHDPASPNLMKWKALYLRGAQDDTVTVNRTSLGFRDEYSLSPRTFLFGQLDYLRDTFKEIDYLIAPTAGIGYKVLDTEPTKFAVDAGVGGVWEKNPGFDVNANGALTAGEQLAHQLNAAVVLRHAATGLWKMDDRGDSLYTVSVGLAVALAEHLQLTIDVLDSYKNRPPTAAIKKNDVAVVTAIVVKY
jgi:putative salt-induced outer membrane protein